MPDVEPYPWMKQAACLDHDPELWFADGQHGHPAIEEPALRICRACPVIAECLAHALANDERYGIWGATTAYDRRAMKRGRA